MITQPREAESIITGEEVLTFLKSRVDRPILMSLSESLRTSLCPYHISNADVQESAFQHILESY